MRAGRRFLLLVGVTFLGHSAGCSLLTFDALAFSPSPDATAAQLDGADVAALDGATDARRGLDAAELVTDAGDAAADVAALDGSTSLDACSVITSSDEHCGACGFACRNAHGSTRCVLFRCEPVCAPGWWDCHAYLVDTQRYHRWG